MNFCQYFLLHRKFFVSGAFANPNLSALHLFLLTVGKKHLNACQAFFPRSYNLFVSILAAVWWPGRLPPAWAASAAASTATVCHGGRWNNMAAVVHTLIRQPQLVYAEAVRGAPVREHEGGSGTRVSVGMGRRGGGCERRWRGALERIAWWIPTVKSDSYLKPSILVLCDTAKEPVTRTGGSQGGMSGSGGIIFCNFLFNWTADKNETTLQELQMLSSVTFIASSLCLSLFEVFSCLNWHRRDLVRLGITCNSGINHLICYCFIVFWLRASQFFLFLRWIAVFICVFKLSSLTGCICCTFFHLSTRPHPLEWYLCYDTYANNYDPS